MTMQGNEGIASEIYVHVILVNAICIFIVLVINMLCVYAFFSLSGSTCGCLSLSLGRS